MVVERCAQCGTNRRGDLQVCVRCETPFPADGAAEVAPVVDVDAALSRPAAPSPTQSHGTMFFAVVCGFVLLAVLLKLSIRGIGPFEVALVETRPAGDTLLVTLDITNTGERAGRANCRIPLRDAAGIAQPAKVALTQRQIPPGETLREVVTLTVADGVRPFGDIKC